MDLFDLKTLIAETPTPEVVQRLGKAAQRKALGILRSSIPAGLRPDHQRMLDAILGLTRGHLPNAHASNIRERLELHAAVGDTFVAAWDESSLRQQRSITITPDAWLIDTQAPIFDLQSARNQAARWMRKLKITGLAGIEFQPFLNHPASEGWVISPHLHIVAYSDDEHRFADDLANFKESMRSHCSVGEFVVGKPIRVTPGDVMKVSSYGFKCLTSATRLSPSRKEPGKYKLRLAPLPPMLALRTAEIMSYMSTSDLIIVRGTAAIGWRRLLWSQLNPCHSARPRGMFNRPDLDRLWSDVGRCCGKPNLSRFSIT